MSDDLSKWWDEDADRLNKMADAAKQIAVKVPQWEGEEEERAFCPNGEGGGVTNTCGGTASTREVVSAILRSIEKTGGFSVHPVSADSPTTGFMCSITGAEKVFDSRDEITEDAITEYFQEHEQFLSRNPQLHLGGWIDPESGKVYLDLSERFEDEKSAVAAGVERKQLAVWDVARRREIRIKGAQHGKRSEEAAGQVRLSARSFCQADRRGAAKGPRRGHGRQEEVRAGDCIRGPGGIFGPGNKCQDGGDSPPSLPPRAASGESWQGTDGTTTIPRQSLPPSSVLASAATVHVLNGMGLANTLAEMRLSLDEAAGVCASSLKGSEVTIAHGTPDDVAEYISRPSAATAARSAVTFITERSIAGIDKAATTEVTLVRTEDDELHLSYSLLEVSPEAQAASPVSVAREMYQGVVSSISEAEKLGVSRVEMYAAGDRNDSTFKGYRIWPRLGFDGVIPPEFHVPDEVLSDAAFDEKTRGNLTIQSLYDTVAGQRWWEENGGGMAMSLSVGDRASKGWQRFERVRKKVQTRGIDILAAIEAEWRSIRDEVESRAFCPTGEGGGLDNSCSAGGAAGLSSGRPASVRVQPDREGDLERSMSRLGLSGVDEVLSLGGGNVRGADVAIKSNGEGFIYVSTVSPIDRDNSSAGQFHTAVSISDGEDGKVLGLESLGLTGYATELPKAKAAKVMSIVSEKVAESIETAEESDFAKVTTFAVGDANSPYKGYRLWPQFGFDGDVPRDIARKIPPEIILRAKGVEIPPPGSTSLPHDLVLKGLASRHRDITIQELISTREGDRWWDANGNDVDLTLDLRDKTSRGYRKWEEMKARLPKLRERNKSRSYFDSLVEQRAFCATGDGNGVDNSCSSQDGGGSATGASIATKARMVDVMIGGKPTTAMIDNDARKRAQDDLARNPKPEGSAPGSATDLWDRSLVGRAIGGNSSKITSLSPAFSPGRVRQNGLYVAHEAVGQYLSMRNEEARRDAGGEGEAAIIDTTEPLTDSQRGFLTDALTDDAIHAYEIGGFDPGFYDADLKLAMKKLETIHPEIATSDNAKFVLTMLVAITSNGQDPNTNLVDADGIYSMYKRHGTVVPAAGQKIGETNPEDDDEGSGDVGGARNIRASLVRFQSMLDSFGVDRTRRLLSGYTTVERVNSTLRTLSERSADPEWQQQAGMSPWMVDHYESKTPSDARLVEQGKNGEFADEVVPVAAIFGPKIGSFFANLSGRHDFLTMDRWLMRSVGRVTGELITRSTPTSASKAATKALEAIQATRSRKVLFGLDRGDQKLTKAQIVRSLKIQEKTGVVEEHGAAYAWAKAAARSYSNTPRENGKGSFGKHPDPEIHEAHKAGNPISKSLIREQQSPRGAMARRQIREVFREIVRKIEERYPERKGQVDVDEVQAVLWQYEKNLWKHLGAKVSIDKNSLYSKAADRLLTRQSRKELRPERRSFARYSDDLGVLDDGARQDWDSVPFGAEQYWWDSDIEESGIDMNDVFTSLEDDFAESRAFCPSGEGNGIDNSCSSSSSTAIRYASGEDAVIGDRLKTLDITPTNLARIAGATGSSVDTWVRRDNGSRDGIHVETTRDVAGVRDGLTTSSTVRNEGTESSPEIVVHHEVMQVSDEVKADPMKRQQAAREFMRIMTTSVSESIRAGADRIEFNAAGRATDSRHFRGYTIWPRMGFDAPLPFHVKQKLPDDLSHCKTLLELHATPEGTRWWRDNGTDVDVSLDLTRLDSDQMKVFNRFVKHFGTERRDFVGAEGSDEWLSPADLAKLDALWQEIWDEGILDDHEGAE